MSSNGYEAYLEAAELAARQAGELLRQKWRQPRQVQSKGFRDWVTDADREAQALMTTIIRQRFPDHAFITEEEDRSLPTRGPVYWVIDPVDGTSNYSRQLPVYCVSIAAAVAVAGDAPLEAQVVAGVIYDPARDEMYSAARGRGAHCNGRPLQASSTADLTQAIIGFDWSREQAQREQGQVIVDQLGSQAHTIRIFGSAALGLAWVAAGRLDGYLNLTIGPWDGAAAALLIDEAGGRMDNLSGQPWRLGDGGCLAGNKPLLPTLAAQVAREKAAGSQ
jgi:myo-inositol-1(or 4)-monophosphatase